MKKALSIIASVFLVVACATTGVFADADFSTQPLPLLSSGTNNAETFNSSLVMSDNGTSSLASFSSDGDDLYAFMYGSGPYTLCIVSSTSGRHVSVLNRYGGSYSYLSGFNNSELSNHDATTLLYYRNGGGISASTSVFVPVFDTMQDGFQAVISATSSVGEVVDVTIPAGYALVIQGECEVLERNFSISNSWDFARSDNNRVNGSSERLLAIGNVIDGFSPDKNLSRSSLIQWQALNANIQGNASNYSFSANDLVSVPSGACFVISYPTLYGYGSAYPANATISHENSVDITGNVYLQYSGDRPTIRVVALESLSEYSSSGQFSTYSVFRPAMKDEILSPSGVSDDGHTILSPSSPLPSGGGNAGQPPVDEDSSLLGTISKFVNDIKNLLSSAVEAINTLVSQGGQFMQNIGAMFTWLPTPLLTVIIGAFTILLVVGVLKVLWR